MKGPTRRKTPRVPEPARDWRFGLVTNVFAARSESKYRDGVQLQFIGAGDLEVQWTRGAAAFSEWVKLSPYQWRTA